MRTRPETAAFAAFLLLCLPSVSAANAGTPLMWAGMLHLSVGNLIIGWIEGVLIYKLFKANRATSIGLMIAANYCSAFAGLVLLGISRESFTKIVPLTIYNAQQFILSAIVAAFVATILIEWPFCMGILRSGKGRSSLLTRGLQASLIAQVLSYALLIPFYWIHSPKSLYTSLHVTRDLSFARKSGAAVFFIDSSDGDIYRIKPDGTGRERVQQADIINPSARLFVRKLADSGSWDLWALDPNKQPSERLILTGFADRADPSWRIARGAMEPLTPDNLGPASDIRDQDKRDWKVRTGFWAAEGISAQNEKTRASLFVAFETPLLQWQIRNATVLPGDIVIAQIESQIVAIDLNPRKIGLVAMGRGPVAVIPQDAQ